MSKTTSIDKEYLKKVVQASKEYQPGDDANSPDISKSPKGVAIKVNIPGMGGAAAEETKEKSTMDELLSGFEDELGIENK